jgi:hypothetical protein
LNYLSAPGTFIGSGHVCWLLGPIAVPIRESPNNSREAINIASIFENSSPSTARSGGCHSALLKTFTTKVSARPETSYFAMLYSLLERTVSILALLKPHVHYYQFASTGCAGRSMIVFMSEITACMLLEPTLISRASIEYF